MSLYRKYRPQKFGEVLGQDHVTLTLTNALSSESFSHAYLFSGPKGSGKTTTARLLAKAINCTGRELTKGIFEPCNKCISCKEITDGKSIDIIEIDAASNRGIDEIRELRDKIRFAPTSSKFKVYIIDECHMLTKEAFNALLKTLEEPPSHAVFIMATTELHKVPPTILSRTQVFDFKKAKISEIEKLLKKTVEKENIKIDDESISLIAKLSFGAFRDALSMLEQVASLQTDGRSRISLEQTQKALGHSTDITVLEFTKLLIEKDLKKALKMVDTLYFEGVDLENFIGNVVSVLRNLLLQKVGIESEVNFPEELISNIAVEELTNMIEKLISASQKVKTSVLGQLPLEMAVFELTEGESGRGASRVPEGVSSRPSQTYSAASDSSSRLAAEKSEHSRDRHFSRDIPPTAFESGLWPKVFLEVKAHNNTLAAILRDAQFAGTSDHQITLKVRFKFHAEQICANKNRAVIEAAVLKIAGSSYKIDCIVDSDLKVKKPLEAEEVLLNSAKEVFEVDE